MDVRVLWDCTVRGVSGKQDPSRWRPVQVPMKLLYHMKVARKTLESSDVFPTRQEKPKPDRQ